MRIGSTNSTNHDYENENNELKKLHEQRMKRQQQQHLQNNQQISPQNSSSNLNKSLKTFNFDRTEKHPRNIFLNSIISDSRNIRDKPSSISLSSLFQDNPRTFSTTISQNIKGVLITTYGFVMDVLGTIAQSGVPFVLVNDSSQNGPGKVQTNFCGYKNMSLVTPPRTKKGYGVFHTKLWLIKFQTFLRVVIGTGNQHAQDWLIWLNAYWYQDFSLKGTKISDYDENKQTPNYIKQAEIKPEKKEAKLNNSKKEQKILKSKQSIISLDDSEEEIQMYTSKDKTKPTQKPGEYQKFDLETDFKETLKLVLKNMFPAEFNLQKSSGIDLEKYDFSNPEVVLIPSIPGAYSQKKGQMENYGMAKLKRVMKTVGPKIKKGSLCYNTSSLGNIETTFLKNLYFSFLPFAESFSTSNYKIIYPSQKYITEKTCGEASVLFLKKENYYKSDIKKEVFYHYDISERNPVKGAIPHLKTAIIENLQAQTQEQRKECIFFMGSHNMTKAAWGSYDKSDSQISFSNSELGILFLRMDREKLQNFLPYKYPPKKYQDYDKPFLRD